jgi:predicted small secreted protein
MKRSRTALSGLLLTALLLGGCASKDVTQPEQYSGFLSDYSQLQPAVSATGQPVMRWIAPGVKVDNYKYIQVRSIGFYPAPNATEQISNKTLDDLQVYASQQIVAAFGRRFQLLDSNEPPRPQTLILRAAITGVDAQAEGLKPYEVIPIALVVAATTTAAGSRDQQTELFAEAEMLDGTTGKPVIRVVRKGFGQALENREEQVTLATLKSVIDTMVRDIEKFHD